MRSSWSVGCRAALFCFAVAARVPAVSRAEAPADKWEWRVTLCGWFPAFVGATEFPTGGTGPSFQVDASSIIENLNFTAMGTLEARKGRWGGWADVHVRQRRRRQVRIARLDRRGVGDARQRQSGRQPRQSIWNRRLVSAAGTYC